MQHQPILLNSLLSLHWALYHLGHKVRNFRPQPRLPIHVSLDSGLFITLKPNLDAAAPAHIAQYTYLSTPGCLLPKRPSAAAPSYTFHNGHCITSQFRSGSVSPTHTPHPPLSRQWTFCCVRAQVKFCITNLHFSIHFTIYTALLISPRSQGRELQPQPHLTIHVS